MSNELIERPGEHLCPHDKDSPYRDAWLDGYAAANAESNKRLLAALGIPLHEARS